MEIHKVMFLFKKPENKTKQKSVEFCFFLNLSEVSLYAKNVADLTAGLTRNLGGKILVQDSMYKSKLYVKHILKFNCIL